MVIEHAERFGLAQLHQLRGRVGRGAEASFCLLLHEDWVNETARRRLTLLRDTEDGFLIADEDFRLRGGGDLLGTRQAGAPGFRLADPVEHEGLLHMARSRRGGAAVARSETGERARPRGAGAAAAVRADGGDADAAGGVNVPVVTLSPARGAARPSAFRTIRARRRRLLGRCRAAGLPCHVGAGSEQPCEQPGNRQIGIQRFPVQAVTRAEDFDLGELVCGCGLQPLGQARRKTEGATVGKFDNDAATLPVIMRRRRTRFVPSCDLATLQRSVDLGISQFGHECSPTGPTTLPAPRQRRATRGESRRESCDQPIPVPAFRPGRSG